jgi:hypothetical protein
VAGWDVDGMDRWTALAPDAVQGDRLTHTDLHGDQFVLGADGQIHVIDWGWPAAAAGWVDTAFMVIRLSKPDTHRTGRGVGACSTNMDRHRRQSDHRFRGLRRRPVDLSRSHGQRSRNERPRETAREYAAWRLAETGQFR